MAEGDDFDDLDPALFGTWTAGDGHEAAADGGVPPGTGIRSQTAIPDLEVKSAEPRDLCVQLLNEMTLEMRGQFEAFRDLRRAAEGACQNGQDDAQAKLARADIKAATEAMSVIVRTLEKIDALQRQFARDRDIEAEQDAESYEQAKSRFVTLINEKAVELHEHWKRNGCPDDAGGGGAASGTGPPFEQGRTAAEGQACQTGCKTGEEASRGDGGDCRPA
ncbi:hypothetical protein MRS76_04840 [Rhizobiaceae bacterium n13]|uniref:Uncharacterized protein n=1 Tax=Ferirhizobium litorale TaxID=2927786 RepID=A0AAE3QAQ7_9HYPH|nr:hypothetical protein [Fererhizobium litorale]MDI7861274.1 hypothetical protein [Fererhizobium litorale]MDI7921421.1 hypothetical protein [Fererhizobium litorale]